MELGTGTGGPNVIYATGEDRSRGPSKVPVSNTEKGSTSVAVESFAQQIVQEVVDKAAGETEK